MITEAEARAMELALDVAQSPDAPRTGPNPRVGAVIISPSGEVLAVGHHRGAGTAHAEVVALIAAGERAKGATAVVTLEPCNHFGRTGPCTQALMAAGIARVVFAQTDPNPPAAGGAAVLRAAGLDVDGGYRASTAEALNHRWSASVRLGRPFVTLKLAATLDGRIAAADGSSRWISSPEAREQVHELRSQVDAVIVGTGTALADDPELTDRRPDADRQPIPVVLGTRDLPSDARLRRADGQHRQLRTHNLQAALQDLFDDGVRQVLVEGGATLASAFLRERLVDVLLWYAAPTLLGAGRTAVGDLGIASIGEAFHWQLTSLTQVGRDVRLELIPSAEEP